MMIGRPFGAAPNQHASIPISRRLTAPNGTFAGVVVAGVRLAWLSDLLSHSPSGSTVTVRRDDGVILMRMPFNADAIGRGATTDAAWQDYMRSGHSPAGDGAGGLRLYRKSGASLLVVEIAQNRTEVLNRAAWPMWQPVLTLIPGLCVVGIGLFALNLRYRNDQIEAAARAANDERMRLLATMSHELRTPLTGILGQAELLTGEGGLSDRQTTRLNRLSEAGNLMRVILNRVTDVARPAGGDSLVLTSCDLDELIRGCTGIVESEARKKGLCLTTIVDPGTPARLLLAREYVQQVLINLLMNAVKYTSEGTVSLRVKSSATSLRLEVADTGPGVPPGQRRRLFRGYDRLDATGSREAGTGLGLSITDDFVHRMEGRIGHANNPSGGSLFWVELPIREPSALAKKVPRKQPASERLSPAETVSDGHALHILLVDDLDLTRSVTADFLRSAGHIVTEAPDGETAIDAVSSNDFDLVLTDMRMPIMDGLEATRRIRALPGHRGTTPIVLVTADLAALERGASGQAGVDHCLMKPFTRTELLTIVATAARVTSGPPDDTGESRVIDASVLAEMESRLGQAMTASHLRAAARRIEDLLAMLECPGVAENPAIGSAAHDLIGGVRSFGPYRSFIVPAALRYRERPRVVPCRAAGRRD
jgi:signal transduction histidine kinase/DNA-binding response OmpR family regulator